MCGTRHNFAKGTQTVKWFAGNAPVKPNDVSWVSGAEFKRAFPSEARGFCYDFMKSIPIADSREYAIGAVGSSVRPITRRVVFVETDKPTKCGAMCRNAKGSMCDCSCKGDNHGAGVAMSRTRFAAPKRAHNISLPRTKRRLNIDEASAALSQMGYRLGNVRYDAATYASIYKITQPNGAVIEVPATKIADFVYGKIKDLNMKSGTKATMAALDGSYAKIDVRYVFPDGTEETETMSGPARNAAASAIRRITAKGTGAKAYVIGFYPADPRGRFPAGKRDIWKGEVAADGRAYERGGSFSRTGAKSTHAADEIGASYLRDIAQLKKYIEEAYDKGRGSHALQLKAQLADMERALAEYKARKPARASRTGAKAKFGSDTRSVNNAAKRYLAKISRTRPPEGLEQFHARLKARLAEIVRDTDAMLRNPQVEEDYGGWSFDDFMQEIRKVTGYSNVAQRWVSVTLGGDSLGGFSRTGVKAAFASAGEVADFFKTLADVERAEMRGDTAKMRTLLQSVAAMVQRDRAKLPSDALAYYDGLRRKAGMSRTGAKAKFDLRAKVQQMKATVKLLVSKLGFKPDEVTGNDQMMHILFENQPKQADRLAAALRTNLARVGVPTSAITTHEHHYEDDNTTYGGVWIDLNALANASAKKMSRTGAKAAFSESSAWIAKYLPALNQWWRDRTDHPTDLDASSDRWEIEGVLDDVAEHCREAVPREAKPSWYAAALRDVKKIQHSRKASMKSHFATQVPNTVADAFTFASFLKFLDRAGTAVAKGDLNLARDYYRQATTMISAHPYLNREGSSSRERYLDIGERIRTARGFSRTGAKAFNTQGANPGRGTYPTSSGASSSRLFSLQQEPNGNLVICKGEAARGFNKVLRVGDMQSMRQELREMSDTDNFSRTGAKAAFGDANKLNDLLVAAVDAMKRGDRVSLYKLMEQARREIDEKTPEGLRYDYQHLKSIVHMSRTGEKSTHAANAVSSKIATLVREGYDQTQAAAIAYDMKRRGEL